MLYDPPKEKIIIIKEGGSDKKIFSSLLEILISILLIVGVGYYAWNFQEVVNYNGQCSYDCHNISINDEVAKGYMVCRGEIEKNEIYLYIKDKETCPIQNITYYPIRMIVKELKETTNLLSQ
jgi:hypothetical protein